MKEDLPKLQEVYMCSSRSFYFDPEKLEFSIGNTTTKQVIKLSEVNDTYQIERRTCDLKADIGLKNSEMMLISPMGSLIETSALRKWINNLNIQEKKEVCRKAESSMVKSYESVTPGIKIEKHMLHHHDTHGISAFILEHGTFLLQTLGEHATLDRTNHLGAFDSIFYRDSKLNVAEQTDISLPTEYGFHNTDYREQRLSLYAGAGTIAWIAKSAIV